MLLLRKLSQTCSFQLPAKTNSDVITISGNPSTSSTINRTKEDHKVTRTPMDYLLERLCTEATWILLLPLSSNPISENQTKKSTISHPIFPGKKRTQKKTEQGAFTMKLTMREQKSTQMKNDWEMNRPTSPNDQMVPRKLLSTLRITPTLSSCSVTGNEFWWSEVWKYRLE